MSISQGLGKNVKKDFSHLGNQTPLSPRTQNKRLTRTQWKQAGERLDTQMGMNQEGCLRLGISYKEKPAETPEQHVHSDLGAQRRKLILCYFVNIGTELNSTSFQTPHRNISTHKDFHRHSHKYHGILVEGIHKSHMCSHSPFLHYTDTARLEINFRVPQKVFYFFHFLFFLFFFPSPIRLQKEVSSHRGVEIGDNRILQPDCVHTQKLHLVFNATWLEGREDCLDNYYPK